MKSHRHAFRGLVEVLAPHARFALCGAMVRKGKLEPGVEWGLDMNAQPVGTSIILGSQIACPVWDLDGEGTDGLPRALLGVGIENLPWGD